MIPRLGSLTPCFNPDNILLYPDETGIESGGK